MKAGERRTLAIVLITALMMVIEIVAGLLYGSMALLADGLHMASHAAALESHFWRISPRDVFPQIRGSRLAQGR
jgi:Co/Zn/Cd efflux system component